jgi:hypothetical protein
MASQPTPDDYEYLLSAAVAATQEARRRGVELLHLESELDSMHELHPSWFEGMAYTRSSR